jgi:TATA element modulatory factor
VEEELETSTSRLRGIEQDLAESKEQVERLQRRVDQSEAALSDTRAQFEQDRKSWEHELLQKLEDERAKCRTELAQPANSHAHSRTQSPSRNNRKGSNSDLAALQNRRLQGVSTLDPGIISPTGRRTWGQQPQAPDPSASPARQDSLTFTIPLNGISSPGTPSVQTADPEEFFDGIGSPSSQHRTINDMISASTAGAGPSVQLVERMSAAVRRLESEKAATKEELIRLSAQRDEAREEVVSLMREIEQKRAADEKVKELEESLLKMNERYETTLEMLGEKSELVEELRADVADLKQMYRELVDSTMK